MCLWALRKICASQKNPFTVQKMDFAGGYWPGRQHCVQPGVWSPQILGAGCFPFPLWAVLSLACLPCPLPPWIWSSFHGDLARDVFQMCQTNPPGGVLKASPSPWGLLCLQTLLSQQELQVSFLLEAFYFHFWSPPFLPGFLKPR